MVQKVLHSLQTNMLSKSKANFYCVCKGTSILHWPLILKSQQNRNALLTRPGIEKRYFQLTGDILLAAGTVAYLGYFPHEERQKEIVKWQERAKQLNVPFSEDYSLQGSLGNQITIQVILSLDKASTGMHMSSKKATIQQNSLTNFLAVRCISLVLYNLIKTLHFIFI